MTRSSRPILRVLALTSWIWLTVPVVPAHASDQQTSCEALNQSGAAFVGVAGAPVDQLVPAGGPRTIAGIVQQREFEYGRGPTKDNIPLGGILVRIFNETYSTEAVTGSDGRFVVAGVPPGLYELLPQLSDDLVTWDSTSRIMSDVRDNGCAFVTIDVLFDGLVRGVLRGPDGQSLPMTTIDLMPADVAPEAVTGHIAGTGSVSTNDHGEFDFRGRPPGRYFLGVSLYNAPNPNGPSYPRTYYPGTTDRDHAVPIVVERGRQRDGFDFSIPRILPKGKLEVRVETDYVGKLTFCFVQLDDLFSRWTTDSVSAGIPFTRAVVDGQRYQVHAHLEFPGGHIESEPYVFTATSQTTTVTLRPDTPRTLHR